MSRILEASWVYWQWSVYCDHAVRHKWFTVMTFIGWWKTHNISNKFMCGKIVCIVGCSHIIAFAMRKENVKNENLFPHIYTQKKSSLRSSRHLIGFFWDKEKPKLKRKLCLWKKNWVTKKEIASCVSGKIDEKLKRFYLWLIHWHFFCKWWYNKSQFEIFLKNIICQKQIFIDWCSFAIDERRLLDINYKGRYIDYWEIMITKFVIEIFSFKQKII